MDKKKKDQKPSSMDILELYSKIQSFIASSEIEMKTIKETIKRIQELLTYKEKYNLRPRIVRMLEFGLFNLNKELDEFENLKYFNFDVQPILEKYHALNKQTMVIPFFNTNRQILKEHAMKKEAAKKEFLQKLKEYTSLKNFEFMMKQFFNKLNMPRSSPPPCVCGNKTEFIKDEDRAVCAICSTEQSLICNTSSFSDVGRVNMASKYTYNRKVHFRDCIIQYQGKQKTHIPDEIYTLIEVKLIERKLVDKYSDLPKEKRYEKITRALILDILKELELKKFYDDIVLIHHMFTGQACDNIEYLEDSLLDDFDKLTETYDNLYTSKDDSKDYLDDERNITKRKNFINAQFVLYQLLRKHGHPCNEMDFLTLKTSERKRFHHTICKELFSILGWKYSYSI